MVSAPADNDVVTLFGAIIFAVDFALVIEDAAPTPVFVDGEAVLAVADALVIEMADTNLVDNILAVALPPEIDMDVIGGSITILAMARASDMVRTITITLGVEVPSEIDTALAWSCSTMRSVTELYEIDIAIDSATTIILAEAVPNVTEDPVVLAIIFIYAIALPPDTEDPRAEDARSILAVAVPPVMDSARVSDATMILAVARASDIEVAAMLSSTSTFAIATPFVTVALDMLDTTTTFAIAMPYDTDCAVAISVTIISSTTLPLDIDVPTATTGISMFVVTVPNEVVTPEIISDTMT